MKKSLFSFLVLAVIAFSCKKEETVKEGMDSTIVPEDIKDLDVPSTFNYKTSRELNTSISVKSINDNPLEGIRIDFYDKDPFEGGEKFASGITQADGILNTDIKIPSYLKEVFIECNYKGFANSFTVSAESDIVLDFGGSQPVRKFKTSRKSTNTSPIPAGGNVYYLSTAGNLGLPDNLENTGDVLSSDFLDDINASLPSGQNVAVHNASYLSSSNEYEVVVNAISDVWVTFVAEGAGYKNSLAYYVYDTDNPPSSSSQIDSVFVIFRNTSLKYSGGELNAGDKVYLGRFPAGKSISWVLFQNAYNSGSNTINVNAQRIYSKADFNPEPIASERQHTVQLVDNSRQLLLNGFEDILRNSGSCDHDFEDLIYYVTANPWTGIDTDNSPDITPSVDADNDGVNDAIDEYPNDAARAFNVAYQGNLGFEDLWPSQGDYDFNDMVMAYDITHVLNAQNEVVDINADWTIRAAGAGFNNGFGWEYKNVLPSDVSSVSGTSLQEGIISTASNGLENGQSLATVIAFDDVFNEIQHAGGPFINTVKTDPNVPVVTKSISISFSSPQSLLDVGLPPYNSFIFVNGDRGKEIHLANAKPTDLANPAYFGTNDDDSDPASERYYKTSNNLPWVMHIYGQYDYPIEYEPIDDAYLNFGAWAQSGGGLFENWYLDLPGFRIASKIY